MRCSGTFRLRQPSHSPVHTSTPRLIVFWEASWGFICRPCLPTLLPSAPLRPKPRVDAERTALSHRILSNGGQMSWLFGIPVDANLQAAEPNFSRLGSTHVRCERPSVNWMLIQRRSKAVATLSVICWDWISCFSVEYRVICGCDLPGGI